ncbi:MAG: hypothetical protein LUG95_05380 [Clostridiales bacterium]|nr:hypothetical protein [Clostridiales bacterium]
MDYEYYDDEDKYEITLYIDYRANDEEEYEVNEAVHSYLDGIDMSAVSDYELLKEFHDYILEICDYNDDTSPDYNYTSYGVFAEGSAVCQVVCPCILQALQRGGLQRQVCQLRP